MYTKINWTNIAIVGFLIILSAITVFSKVSNEKQANITSKANQNPSNVDVVGALPYPGADEFVVGLDSWVGGTPALLAQNRGYNKDYKLSNMRLEFIQRDIDRMKALKDNKIHITEMTLASFVKMQDQFKGEAYVVGITDFSRGADGVIVKSNINTINDLEGKKVAFTGDGTGKFLLNKFLRLVGLRYEDIVPLSKKDMGEVLTEFKSGNADAIVSWSPDMIVAMNEINKANPDSTKVLITTKETPTLLPTVLVVSKTEMVQHPERVRAFLKTWFASVKYIHEKPQKAYEKIADLMTKRKDNGYYSITAAEVEKSFNDIKLMSAKDNGIYLLTYFAGNINDLIKDTNETLIKFGDMQSSVMANQLYNNSFLRVIETDEDLKIYEDAEAETALGPKKEFKELTGESVEIETEKIAKIDIPPVYYDSGKATIKRESEIVLLKIAEVLRQFPDYYLIIDAHTDTDGDDDSNLKLSIDRANTVADRIVKLGFDKNRIIARGWGETRLLVEEKTSNDKARNRRTEFILTREK